MMCLFYIRYCLVQRIMEINYKENLSLQMKMLTELEGDFSGGVEGDRANNTMTQAMLPFVYCV